MSTPHAAPVAPAAAPAGRGALWRSSLGRGLAVLGIIGLLAAPTAYLYHAVSSVEAAMQGEATRYAAFLNERLGAGGATPGPAQLESLAADPAVPGHAEGRRIVRDASGRILSDVGSVGQGPMFAVTVPVLLAQGQQIEVEVQRSSHPVLWRALGVGSLALVLGALIALVVVQGYRRGRGPAAAAASTQEHLPTLRPEVARHEGLLTRSAFVEQVRASIERAAQQGDECSIFHLDLDHFKMINGAVGQTWAEELLDKVALVVRERIDSLVLESDLPPAYIGAPGGDVFLIVVEKLPCNKQVTEAFARGVLDSLGSAFEVGPYQLYLSASIGVSHLAGRQVAAERLIREAELAKIFAKRQGAGSYAIHDSQMDVKADELDELGQRLRQALTRDEFLLYYQPKVHLATGVVTGVEALLRWQPEGEAMVMPDRFIPVLEETGLIVPVGAWVLREACRQVMAWRGRGMPPISVAVNVSARQLQQRCFVETVESVLKETGLEPRYLELELTETIFVDNANDNIRMLARLAELGVSLAIDDFGTGHSSLSYLSNFSPRTLKIDRSFLVEAQDGADNIAIARAIIALGHGMGLYVVAEGVETEAQADFLRGYGCDQMQGYLLSRPQSAEQMEQWLRARLKGLESLAETRRSTVLAG